MPAVPGTVLAEFCACPHSQGAGMKQDRMDFRSLILLLLLISPGCGHLAESRQVAVNRERASQAWKFAPERRAGSPISDDYADGWKEGYFDVANGGSGQVPVVPPRQYWRPKFQNNEGQQQISDWFAGFRTGAGAALACNAGSWNSIPTSVEEADATSNAYLLDAHESTLTPSSAVAAAPPAAN